MNILNIKYALTQYNISNLIYASNSKYKGILFLVKNIMYLMPEGCQYGRNMQHVLTGLIKVMDDGNTYVSF
jgi:hypothetical protein